MLGRGGRERRKHLSELDVIKWGAWTVLCRQSTTETPLSFTRESSDVDGGYETDIGTSQGAPSGEERGFRFHVAAPWVTPTDHSPTLSWMRPPTRQVPPSPSSSFPTSMMSARPPHARHRISSSQPPPPMETHHTADAREGGERPRQDRSPEAPRKKHMVRDDELGSFIAGETREATGTPPHHPPRRPVLPHLPYLPCVASSKGGSKWSLGGVLGWCRQGQGY